MAPKKKKVGITVNCPMCNTPRRPRLMTIENSMKNLCISPTCSREVFSDDTIIPKEIKTSAQYLETYTDNFRSIGQGLVVLGSIQSIFNVRFSTFNKDQGVEEIIQALTTIHENQVFSYKVALSFGRILTCTEDAEEKVMYFHASANNSSLFYDSDNHQDAYFLVSNDDSFQTCLQVITSSVKDDTHRPNTKWQTVGNVNANITILRSSGGNVLLGRLDKIPPNFNKRGMVHFHRHPKTKRVYNDNLCFFRCVAQHLYKSTSLVLQLFHKAYPDVDPYNFKGVSLNDITRLEELFQIRVRIFSLTNSKKKGKQQVTVVRSKLRGKHPVINLNLYKSHLSLIVDMEKYGQVYSCDKCHRVLASAYNLKRHTAITKDCTKVKFVYKGGVYRSKKTIFQKLKEIGVDTPDNLKIYPFKIVFDFESYFVKSEIASEGKNTKIEVDHVPLSASVASDFPGYEKPVCFVRETNKASDPLVESVLTYIDDLGAVIGEAVKKSFADVLAELAELVEEHKKLDLEAVKLSGLQQSRYSKSIFESVQTELLTYIRRVPVVGFNSGRYDLNLIKREFHSFFSSREKTEMTTIKRCNQYIAVYTNNLVFLDMFNYLAPGYSYANYLKAFLKDTEKGFFPYEWMTSVRKLQNTRLPTRSAFYSSLTGKTLSVEEYKGCLAVWEKQKMKTMKDYLIYYNNLDVEPFVRAINAHSKFFTERGVDMFKDGLTLPGLTLKFLFENTCANATPYTLFGNKESDVHNLLRKNLVGGPSIIFHRHHSSHVTRIRERQYGSQSKVCRHILGVDANSLYLKCMGEKHCTGFYLVRRRENDFEPVLSHQVSYSATEWLLYRTQVDGVKILHQYNYGEVRVGTLRIQVDGFVPDQKLIYQFHGCYWHGHTCQLNRAVLASEKGQKWLQERAEHTLKVTTYLKALGYTVVEEYECKWLKLRKSVDVVKLKPHWAVKRPQKKSSMTETSIIQGVLDGSIFGLIQVDIHTPEHLKADFAEMTPIFKNSLVSLDDVGDHMRKYLEASGKLKQPQRQLIGSFYGNGILLGTPLLQWYLQKGLKVSKVHLVVEYTPEKTFEPFVQQVTAARRRGDENVECKILSDLYKLLGNSSYGKTICNKQNFVNTKYVSPNKARKLVLHWSVQEVQDISENTVELSCLPISVTYDLPVQIGYMVYQYAKLKMLAFYYDFLLKFIDTKDFEMCEMDTDSFYFALSKSKLDDAVKPEMREQYFTERHLWLPSESCDDPHHRESYIQSRTNNLPWLPLPCCKSRLVFDKRTPGLFKIEWEGDEMTALNSKCYIGSGVEKKISCKGVIQRQNTLSSETYKNVLETENTHMVSNKGFKVVNHHISTYTQTKRGLNYQYIKRRVCEDGVSTEPLDI